MSQVNNILVFQMTSGVQIIGRVVVEEPDFTVVDYPFELEVEYDETGASRLYINRYLPYGLSSHVALFSHNIEAVVVANELYAGFYHRRVELLTKTAPTSSVVSGSGSEAKVYKQEPEPESDDDFLDQFLSNPTTKDSIH